jgi:hypothetical protein
LKSLEKARARLEGQVSIALRWGGILASTLDHGLASACGVWGNVQGLVSACGVMVIFCSTNDDEKLRALESALRLVGKQGCWFSFGLSYASSVWICERV